MKIIEYTSVSVGFENIYELGELVTNKIKEGFQPYGYPCTSGANNGTDPDGGNEASFLIVQALVKYEKAENSN